MASSTLRKRYKEAQKVDFPGIEETSNSYIEELFMAQANAIGCPPEFLYFPFLTTTAGKLLDILFLHFLFFSNNRQLLNYKKRTINTLLIVSHHNIFIPFRNLLTLAPKNE